MNNEYFYKVGENMEKYDLSKLSAREFELLALNFVNSISPHSNWRITKSTGDFNRDFEAKDNDYYKWGEAKHSKKESASMTKSRLDPTLLSAMLQNNVNEIYFVTTGRFTLEYIMRSEHFKRGSISKIIYINGFILNEWLNGDLIFFDSFNESEININTCMQKIRTTKNYINDNDYEGLINIFNTINNQQLEPVNDLRTGIIYEVNIVIFSPKNGTNVRISIPDVFIVNKIIVKSLSVLKKESTCNDEIYNTKDTVFNLDIGYNQIILKGIFIKNELAKDIKFTVFSENNREICYLKKISILENLPNITLQSIEVTEVENLVNIMQKTKMNLCYESFNLEIENIMRDTDKNSFISSFNTYIFSKSETYNAELLCRFAMLLFFGNTIEDIETNSLKNVINRHYLNFQLISMVQGVNDYVFAIQSITEFLNNEKLYEELYNQTVMYSEKSIFFLGNVGLLSATLNDFLQLLIKIFRGNNKSSLIILNKKNNLPKTKNFFSIENLEECREYIDKHYSNKCLNKKENDKLLNIANNFFEATDFYHAMFFYNILANKIDVKNNILILFNYATCLNHCGSMNKSKELFLQVLKLSKNCSNRDIKKIALEAQTEIYNIDFWQLNVSDLSIRIQNFLSENDKLLKYNSTFRDKYSYYNCLNRNMVTQYLNGNYNEAEMAFNLCLNSITMEYTNYIAFTNMDSARGLYKIDIDLAYKRLCDAFDILKKLSSEGKEKRRYLDCCVEKTYVEFIQEFIKKGDANIEPLIESITEIKNYGYFNMLIKCYLKLATCYLSLCDIDKAFHYLTLVKNNCNFTENTRTEFLYNDILSKLFIIKNAKCVKNLEIDTDYYKKTSPVTFNCSKKSDAIVYLETRVW